MSSLLLADLLTYHLVLYFVLSLLLGRLARCQSLIAMPCLGQWQQMCMSTSCAVCCVIAC